MKSQLPELSEHQIQAGFFQEVNYKYRLDETFRPILLYAVLNGALIGGRNLQSKSALIQKYKDEGWKSGIPDMMYDQPRGLFSKLVIEFKRTSKRNSHKAGMLTGGLEPEQIEFLRAIYPYALVRVCYTKDEALAAFDYYMALGQSVLPSMDEREKIDLPLSAIIKGYDVINEQP